MMSMLDDYTVESTKDVEEATASVEEKAAQKGFSVLGVHDLQTVFSRKGLPVGPARVVEICNEEFGSRLLNVDPLMSLMMPCKIAVYARDGRTFISALRPRALADYIPQLITLADQGDAIMCSIVEEAK